MKQIINVLVLITLLIWIAVFSIDNSLHIIACDVGQGDAILIQKSTTQILIDGGPNNKVLDCLGRYMPFWDKQIELVILTHPENDHFGGLIDVFRSYKVLTFGSNGQVSSSQDYKVLEKEVGRGGTKDLILNTGYQLRLGMIYLDILNPEGNSQSSINDNQTLKTNDLGVVILLKYAQFKALFTADVKDEASDKLSEMGKIQNVNYLKVNHHGSKNGLSQKLLDIANPNVAIISVGKNSYGHPHEEVLKMLSDKGVKVLRTDETGDINIEIKNK
jgi:competence protein ComEC